MCGTSPKMARRSVDFPAPFGPMSAVSCPQWTWMFTPEKISTRPKDTPKSSIFVQQRWPQSSAERAR